MNFATEDTEIYYSKNCFSFLVSSNEESATSNRFHIRVYPRKSAAEKLFLCEPLCVLRVSVVKNDCYFLYRSRANLMIRSTKSV
jgi:hypothetical protein